jgi:branched-chain amino acid transport system substrate-binding protein
MNDQAASQGIIKEVDELKKLIFLIIACLLVLGIVLPGCGGEGEGEEYIPWSTLKTPGKLTIGVTGAMGYDQGLHALYGAQLAATDVGTFSVGNQSLTVQIQSIETNEVLNPGGAGGTAAVSAAISSCDFMVGGFRTEGVLVYREPIMTANMTFFNCGAATEILQNAVLTNYDRYKWFFKATPMNEYQLSVMQSKVLGMAVAMVQGGTGNSSYAPKIALLAEDAEWTRTSREAAQAKFNYLGYAVRPTPWLVSPTATNIGTTLNDILSYQPDIVYTIMSGPVGVTYANQVGTYMPKVLSLGINVEAQRQEFPSVAAYANGYIFLDGWALGTNMTDQTAKFVADFMAAHSGKWPIYTAATYDACRTLVEALQAEGYVEGSTVKYVRDDVVSYLEGNIRTGTASTSAVYPKWDGVTRGNYTPGYGIPAQTNLPALNEGQVAALYPWLTSACLFYNPYTNSTYNWTYSPNDFTMPPFTSHDLVFGMRNATGAKWATGIASQWQWNGTGLQKVCIFPKPYLFGSLLNITDMATWLATLPFIPGSSLYTLQWKLGIWDQYGFWHWQYPGTGTANLTSWITWLATRWGGGPY